MKKLSTMKIGFGMWNIGTSLEEENGEAIIKKYQIFQTSRKASTAFYYKSHNSKTNVKSFCFWQ
jgi:hypothetical protein